MSNFTESKAAEQMIFDAITRHGGTDPLTFCKDTTGNYQHHGRELLPHCWDYLPTAQIDICWIEQLNKGWK